MNLSINSKYHFNKEGKNYFSKQMTSKVGIEIRISLHLAKQSKTHTVSQEGLGTIVYHHGKCVSLQSMQARVPE